MKADLFEPLVTGWSTKLEWSKEELKQAAKLLLAISKANAGEIAPDTTLDMETNNAFALQQVESALARKVIPYAKMLQEKCMRPRYTTPSGQPTMHVFPELVSHEWNDCIDINTDDADELCKLPGINHAIALRVIDYRFNKGRFSELEQLTNIEGIDATVVGSLKYQAYCGTQKQTLPLTKELAAFIHEPTFRNYVEMVVETKDAPVLPLSANGDPKAQLLTELKEALDDVMHNKYGAARNLKLTRATRVLADRKRKLKATKIKDKGTHEASCGALLYDTQYSPFISKLIEQATVSINVIMFFMKYEDGAGYTVNSLVESLIKAHQNGVEVKVILDKDAEEDVIGSRLINEPAFQVLKKNNVPVLYDSKDRMIHSKFVVVDGKHVVLGSHNWTGGSFWAYDDTSIYVESGELGQKYRVLFDTLWNEYNNQIFLLS